MTSRKPLSSKKSVISQANGPGPLTCNSHKYPMLWPGLMTRFSGCFELKQQFSPHPLWSPTIRQRVAPLFRIWNSTMSIPTGIAPKSRVGQSIISAVGLSAADASHKWKAQPHMPAVINPLAQIMQRKRITELLTPPHAFFDERSARKAP